MAKLLKKAKDKTLNDCISFVSGYIKMSIDRARLSRIEPISTGVTEVKRDTPIVISLTSFPARIQYVSKCVKTLLCQSLKPDEIILWLAEEQFPNKIDDLPLELLHLQEYGLKIRWCRDLKSYKKLIPSIIEYPNCIIVTTDDDLLYDKEWLELLYKTYLRNTKCIICHRITKVYRDENEWRFVSGGKEIYEYPSYLNKLVGCGGVLYPPGSLNREVLNEKAFMKLCPTNDDIWFWCMGVMNGYKIMPAYDRIRWNKEIKGTSSSALSNTNIHKVVRDQLDNVLRAYPEINERLMREVLNH